ncbi:hypothetical protein GS601_01415 [Myxacorys almedinensis A]|uniref:DUF8166 domain-containing protein n=2 Tax=Myxacorys TaxID=2056239 RepID=A0A8J7YWI4_9CYAN|nr:hypothetical protein [Myxacorys almedinensis]NDJ15957.1 hypothetical protein [Myxacorys almedinensis A]
MRLGKVVKSNSHCDYVVQVDDEMDFINAPQADDYGFGTFVKLEDEPHSGGSHRHWAIGIVYNSQLLNPAFLSSGVRLTSEPDPMFTPDQIQEVRTLLWTVLVGAVQVTPTNRTYGIQGIPRVVVPVNTQVHRMTTEEIHQFHLNQEGRSQFCYYSHLLRCGGTFSAQLTHQVLEELIQSKLFKGAEERALIVLCRELAWKNTMGAMK